MIMGDSSREHIHFLLAQSDGRQSFITSFTHCVVTSSLTDSATARRCGVVSLRWKTMSIAHCPLPIRECCQPGPRSLCNGPPHLAAVTSGRGPFCACHKPRAHSDSRTQRIYMNCDKGSFGGNHSRHPEIVP